MRYDFTIRAVKVVKVVKKNIMILIVIKYIELILCNVFYKLLPPKSIIRRGNYL